MSGYRAIHGAGTLVLCGAFCATPSVISAQTANQQLPAVTVDAPSQRPAVKPAKKPAPRIASRRNKPVATTAAGPSTVESDGSGLKVSLSTPAVKQRFQLPQESFSITAKQIDETINLKDPEAAIKYMPSLFVRKRNDAHNQAVLATRNGGLNSSGRTLFH